MKRTQEILDKTKSGTAEPDAVFQAVCKDVEEHTDANRVSIWRFSDSGDTLHCACFYEAEKEAFSKGQVLSIHDQPTYFETIKTHHFVVAPDARNHPATAEFTNHYFKEHDIYSLLDFILHENFKPVGVICCENAGEHRMWRDQDVSYLRQISTLISFFFKIS